MFDSVCCSKMNQDSLAQVSSAALFVLKDLLKTESVSVESATIEAQHLSSSQEMPMHIRSRTISRQDELFHPPTELPRVPAEIHRRMVRLLARMLNEHLSKRSLCSSGQPEAGDE